MTKAKISEFWNWFQAHEATYRLLYTLPEKQKKKEMKELYRQLALYSKGLDVEMYWGKEPGKQSIDLIVTSHGRQKLFKRIDKLVQKAPAIEGWNIISLQPPRPLDFMIELEFGDVDIDYDNIQFTYTTISTITGRLWMEVYIEYYGEVPKEYRHAIATVIYNMLGERSFGLGIASMHVTSIFEITPEEREKLFPLSELPGHIDIREMTSLTVGEDGSLGRDL